MPSIARAASASDFGLAQVGSQPKACCDPATPPGKGLPLAMHLLTHLTFSAMLLLTLLAGTWSRQHSDE